jgi:hypothetical protein
MKAPVGGRREWGTVLLGAYLIGSPWTFGILADAVTSTNAWFVGAFLVVAALRAPALFGPHTAESIKTGVGAWLLASPFVLGFARSLAAWNAWAVGALTIALADVPTAAFALVTLAVRFQRVRLGLRARMLSPRKLVWYGGPEEQHSPGRLCWRIVERSHQIHKTLRQFPSEAQVEACILGHATCVRDLTSLGGLIAGRLPKSGPLRRRKLGLLRWAATRSVHRAGDAFPRALGISQRSGSK